LLMHPEIYDWYNLLTVIRLFPKTAPANFFPAKGNCG
jgi:hypothetical protein